VTVHHTADWRGFFDAHAPHYMENCFVTATAAEADFIVKHLELQPPARILDVGCGTGRHSVELSRRGYRVTGLDLSGGMLAQARKAAHAAGVEVTWIQADATAFVLAPQFDAAICLCEGAFGLLGSGDDPVDRDLAILRNICSALKPGGGFILTALNACRPIRGLGTPQVEGSFDPLTMTTTSTMPIPTASGQRTFTTRERHFSPTELALMCRVVGFQVRGVTGGTAGNWRLEGFDPDEMELMVIARKPA